MDKPVAAIERMRSGWLGVPWREIEVECKTIAAYLDSIPDGAVCVVWPKELTRERLEELAFSCDDGEWVTCAEALRALAAIAPVRKRRVVDLWQLKHDQYALPVAFHAGKPQDETLWKPVARNIELED